MKLRKYCPFCNGLRSSPSYLKTRIKNLEAALERATQIISMAECDCNLLESNGAHKPDCEITQIGEDNSNLIKILKEIYEPVDDPT